MIKKRSSLLLKVLKVVMVMVMLLMVSIVVVAQWLSLKSAMVTQRRV